MTNDQLHIRRIEASDELVSARSLAREFGQWASEQIKTQLRIVVAADADHPTQVLDEVLKSGGRLNIAELDGQPLRIGGLERLNLFQKH